MRLPVLILAAAFAAGPALAEHDRHHRSVPRAKVERPAPRPLAAPAPAAKMVDTAALAPSTAAAPDPPRTVRVILPSPFQR